jgi:transposase
MAKKTYTEEFKREAVRLALSGEKSRLQVSQDLGVGYGTLSGWVTRFAKPLRVSGKVPQLSESERIRELERECRELRQERDILKKAAAYFAKVSG